MSEVPACTTDAEPLVRAWVSSMRPGAVGGSWDKRVRGGGNQHIMTVLGSACPVLISLIFPGYMTLMIFCRNLRLDSSKTMQT